MKLETIVKDLISESDKRTAIKNVLGFNDDWANAFHEINQKLSIWVANTFLDDFIKNKMPNLIKSSEMGKLNLSKAKPSVVEFLNKQGSKFYTWTNEYEPEYRHIMDWVTSPRRRDQTNLKTLTFRDALDKSNEWHESLEGNVAMNYIEKNEVLFDYRDSNGIGFYWVNLKTDFSSEESDRMGHCGRDGGCILFSLRSINDLGESRSHVTISYDEKGKIARQIKGRKNSKPKAVYHKYIIDILLNPKYPIEGLSKNTYRQENNFSLNDLNNEQLNYVFSKNKELKMFYLYGDKKKISVNGDDENIVLFKEESGSNYYGVVNIETNEVIKNYEYVINDSSVYSEFLHFPKENIVIVLKHFVSDQMTINKNEFIIKVINKKFYFINKEEADKLLESSEKDSFDNWSKEKIKGG